MSTPNPAPVATGGRTGTIAAVAAGGAAGTGLRLLAGLLLPFGAATLAANALGCALLGFVTARMRSTNAAALLGTGFAGALTTFSGFAVEAIGLGARSGTTAVLYVLASLALGGGAALAGCRAGSRSAAVRGW